MSSGTPQEDTGGVAVAEPRLIQSPPDTNQGSQERAPEPLRLPAPLSQLPWDIAQDEFGVQGAAFIGVMGTLLLRSAQDQFRAYVVDSKAVAVTHAQSATQDQMRFGP